MSVDELGDNCFVIATEALRQIADAFESEAGRKPSLAELCEVLTWGVRGCGSDLFEDAANSQSTICGKSGRRGRIQLRRGDLVCLPTFSGRVAILLYLGQYGRFGKAFAIFDDLAAPARVGATWTPHRMFEHAVFVDEEYIQSGRWFVKGNRADLAEHFGDPELYHDPRDDPGDGSYGKFGLAESASGVIRELKEHEFQAVFERCPVRYECTFTGQSMEKYLLALLAPRAAES